MLSVSGVNGIGAANGFDGSSVLLASGGMDDEGRKKGTRGMSLLSPPRGCTKNLWSGSSS